MGLRSGDLIGRRTRLIEPIGAGAMGTVWLARHLTLDCDVAVKVLSGKQLTTARRARFAREAKLAARIKSPYVVRIFDYGVSEQRPFIVMEKLDGCSLAHRLATAGALPLEQARSLGLQLCSALSQAHALRVVHRDLKPHNVFLVADHPQLFAKLVDFGVAKLFDHAVPTSVTRTGMMVGTPRYMSPEQLFNAKGVGAHADLWALAVTLYEATTGRPPFDASSVGRLWQQIDEARFPLPSALRNGAGAPIDAWFLQALRRDKARRFVDAGAMAEAWQDAFDGKAPRVSRPGTGAVARASGVAAAARAVGPSDVAVTLDDALVLSAATGDEDIPRERVSAGSWNHDRDDVEASTISDLAVQRQHQLPEDATLSRPLAGDALLSNAGLALDDAVSVSTADVISLSGDESLDPAPRLDAPRRLPPPRGTPGDVRPRPAGAQPGHPAQPAVPVEQGAGTSVRPDSREPHGGSRRYLIASLLALLVAVLVVWWPHLWQPRQAARQLPWRQIGPSLAVVQLSSAVAPQLRRQQNLSITLPPAPPTTATGGRLRPTAAPVLVAAEPSSSASAAPTAIDPCRQPLIAGTDEVLRLRPDCLKR